MLECNGQIGKVLVVEVPPASPLHHHRHFNPEEEEKEEEEDDAEVELEK